MCVHHLESLRPVPSAVLDRDVNIRIPMEFSFRFYSDEELFRSDTFHRFFSKHVHVSEGP